MPHLTLKVLGRFEAHVDGVPVTGFNSDKTRALLTYLAIESDRPHRRESLTGLLWPDVTDTAARQSLSQALSNLRKILGARDGDAANSFILADRDTVQFNRQSDYDLDAQRLLVAAGRNSSVNAAADAAADANIVAIYRGPLLDGFTLPDADTFEEWLTLQREALQRAALDALDVQVAQATQTGSFNAAIDAAARQLAIDPWREESHRHLMQAYALGGQRSAALAQYEKCRQVLQGALGVEPSNETRQLFEKIKQGDLTSQTAPAQSAAPKTARPIGTNLPRATTAFVGRQDELHALGELLADAHTQLISVVALGGMGKTRLAIEAASHAVAGNVFTDGVAFVPLTSARDTEQTVNAIAAALKFGLNQHEDAQHQLAQFLADRRVLLVLDNVEQLLSEHAFIDMVSAILSGAARVKLLVTSRAALHLQAETVFPLDGMHAEGRALFLQSARRAQANFRPTEKDERAIDRICTLVEGMPLGIELAASWLNVMSCEEIAGEIERSIDFLETTLRDVPERHHSMTAVFDASWRLMPEAEQHIVEGLSVFRGSFTRDMARQVTGVGLATLSQLVSKSLVRRVENNRYDLHELQRQYARSRLQKRGNAEDEVRRKHAQAYTVLLESLERRFYGPEANALVNDLAIEQSNVRSALEWTTSRGGDAELALRLATAAVRYYYMLPNWHEGDHWLRLALKQGDSVDDPLLVARARMGLGMIEHAWGSYDASLATLQTALETFAKLGDAWHIAWTECQIYQSHFAEGRFDIAEGYARRSLDRFVALHDEWAIAYVKWQLGHATIFRRDYDEASKLARESRDAFDRMGDTACTVLATNLLGSIAIQQDDLQQAYEQYHWGLQRCLAKNIHAGIAWCTQEVGEVLLMLGRCEESARYLTDAIPRRYDIGDAIAAYECAQGMAILAAQQGDFPRAARWFGAASRGPRGAGFLMKPWLPKWYEAAINTTQAALGEAVWATEFRAGAANTMQTIVANLRSGARM